MSTHSDKLPSNDALIEGFRGQKLQDCQRTTRYAIPDTPQVAKASLTIYRPPRAPGQDPRVNSQGRLANTASVGTNAQDSSARLMTDAQGTAAAELGLSGQEPRSPAAPKRTRGSGRARNRTEDDPDFARNTGTAPSRRTLYDPRRDSTQKVGPPIAARNRVQRKENVIPPVILSQRSPVKPEAPQPTLATRHHQRLESESDTTAMIREPETRNISTKQLISEVRGIYAGLIMVEAKCAEVDKRQHQVIIDASSGRQPILNNEQWQALTALHRTLLHEHHDFFLASQHPAASPALKKLAEKYDMPSRMWRHGIHSFLELQRHHLPYSLEQMLTFIYLAYSMMALLYETVPAFEITWIECLGDLARYRMAIEDETPRDREIWQNVARGWYTKGSDKTPTVGRLYHHLAILARPNILAQLFYYCKSLSVSQPFSAARESILTVFDPTPHPDVQESKNLPVDAAFVQLHSIVFTHIDLERFDEGKSNFIDLLDRHVGKYQARWKVYGCYIAVCNITALYGYGAKDSLLRKAWKEGRKDARKDTRNPGDMVPEYEQKTEPVDERKADPAGERKPEPTAGQEGEALVDGLLPPYSDANDSPNSYDPNSTYRRGNSDSPDPMVTQSIQEISSSIQQISLDYAKSLAYEVLKLTLERIDDRNCMPHWHTWMAFLHHITGSAPAMSLIEYRFPWASLLEVLNHLLSESTSEKLGPVFPHSKPLPEDYTLRGLDFVRNYYPDSFFDNLATDEDRAVDNPSMAEELASLRSERLLWLALRICEKSDWLDFDDESRTFTMNSALKERIRRTKEAEDEAAQKQAVEISEAEDEEMVTTACTNSEDEDYIDVQPELRKLKDKKRRLEAQLQAAAGSVVVSEPADGAMNTPIVKGVDALALGITAFVVDTNLLVSHLDAFNLIISKQWSVIIPNPGISYLDLLLLYPD